MVPYKKSMYRDVVYRDVVYRDVVYRDVVYRDVVYRDVVYRISLKNAATFFSKSNFCKRRLIEGGVH